MTISLDTLKETEVINYEIVTKIIKELTEKLNESIEQFDEVKKRNLPKIQEIQKERKAIFEEIKRLKEELNELNYIQPLNVLEKRRMDFKTEGEYISKILNRNIKEEFVNQMKRELKQLATDESESIDQISCTAIPGCDELNEKLAENGIDGIFISKKAEKFLSTLNKCHTEIVFKVYSEEKDKQILFETFCVDLIGSFFKRRCEAKKSNVNSLPQFVALLLNDLSVSIVFFSIHFKRNSGKLKKIAKNYFEEFVKGQKEEISNLICDFNVKSLKRVSLFLTRLEKVLKPLMLKSYLINLQFILLNFAQEIVWTALIKISDISEDEIEDFGLFCREAIDLEKENEPFSHLLRYKPKLKCYEQILKLSLIEIVICYHRGEFKEISEDELAGMVKAIFASSPLRNEFIKELELGPNLNEEMDQEYF